MGLDRPELKLLDPNTLAELAVDRPAAAPDRAAGAFNDFSGGGYFYLDNRDRAVIPTSDAPPARGRAAAAASSASATTT